VQCNIDGIGQDMQIVSLFRYPVKGLSAEALPLLRLRAGETVPFDRAFAIENGPGRFDPDAPRYLPKVNFLMLMRNERLAALQTAFDEATETLTIFRDGKQVARGALTSKLGRQMLEQFFAAYMQGELKGPPRIVSSQGHSFSDVAAKCLHLVNLATVRDLERTVEAPLDPLRFRANVYFEGAGPWEEKRWLERVLQVGSVSLKVFAETTRCEATNVNPTTAQRDTAIPPTLQRTYGHSCLGIYAKVIGDGEIRLGDSLTLKE
jgi:MOSC domain-containing protein